MKKKNKPREISLGIPEHFFERLNDLVGATAASEIRKTFVRRPTTFRVNRVKCPIVLDQYGKKQPDELIQNLQRDGFQLEKVSWYSDAYILRNKSKRELIDLEIYQQGKIYVQSLASMVPPLVLDPQSGEKILDLTAAPGSKTSQMAALMKKNGELVANDNNKIRFFKLKHNMELLGVGDGISSSKTPRNVSATESHIWQFILRMEHGAQICQEYPNYFDKILLDAPCSAEARFVEGEPKSYGYWKESKVKEMAFKQRTLLLAAWGALKPGGTLVYSTCTFAPEENELQIARLLERFPDAEIQPITIDLAKALSPLKSWKNKELPKELKATYRIMPTKEVEGFFVAKIKKMGGCE